MSPRGAAGPGSSRACAAAPVSPLAGASFVLEGSPRPCPTPVSSALRLRKVGTSTGGIALVSAERGQEEHVSKPSFSFSACVSPGRCTVQRHGGARQPHEHDEAQHQNPDPVGPEPGTDPGLRLPPPAAVLRGAGALPQARPQRWAPAALAEEGQMNGSVLCLVVPPV